MARKIILYFNGTFVHLQNGAHRRVAGLLSFLLAHGHEIIVYSFSNHHDCPWTELEINLFQQRYPGVALALDRRSALLTRWTKTKKLLSGIFPASIQALLSIRLPGLTPQYDRIRRENPDALHVVNYANGLVELNGIFPSQAIIETHDLDYLQFSKRFGPGLTSLKIISKYRSEIGFLESAAALISIAKTETGLFRLYFPEKPIFFVPDYGSNRRPLCNRSNVTHDYDVLFVGSKNQFNVEGIISFIIAHQGLLKRFSLAIAGEVSTIAEVSEAASGVGKISLLGFVDDLASLYARSRIVISPVDGTGLKIKVIEALAHGKPVFGSQHSIDGLPAGSEQCVFKIDDELMARMLNEPTRLSEAARAALAYSENLAQSGDLRALQSFLTSEVV